MLIKINKLVDKLMHGIICIGLDFQLTAKYEVIKLMYIIGVQFTIFLPSFSSTCFSGRVVWISVAILIVLFSVQRFGTDKVGYTFAPIISIWFSLNAGIGLYNFIKYDPTVIKAVNPWHIIEYFRRNGTDAWVSLGGVVLCITGLSYTSLFSWQRGDSGL